MQIIQVTQDVYREVMDWANQGQKINAIKVLREHSMCGLREAKEAIEHEMGTNQSAIAKMQRFCSLKIESITVRDVFTGNLMELSISELELKFLQMTQSIGMDAVADLLNLTEFLKTWQKEVKN